MINCKLIKLNHLSISLLLIACCFFGCKTTQSVKVPDGLRKLSDEEIIDRGRRGLRPDVSKITYMFESGEKIAADSLFSITDKMFGYQDYVNAEGEVVFAVVRERTKEDSILQQKRRVAFNEGPDIKSIDVDCTLYKETLIEIDKKDQLNREESGKIDPQIDFNNLELVVNFMDQCGYPTFTSEINPYETIWFVIQHSKLRHQKKYISEIKRIAEEGKLRWKFYCMMYDRIKLFEKKPQLYGTQFINYGKDTQKLYEVEDIENLNERRKQFNLPPVDEYWLKLD